MCCDSVNGKFCFEFVSVFVYWYSVLYSVVLLYVGGSFVVLSWMLLLLLFVFDVCVMYCVCVLMLVFVFCCLCVLMFIIGVFCVCVVIVSDIVCV